MSNLRKCVLSHETQCDILFPLNKCLFTLKIKKHLIATSNSSGFIWLERALENPWNMLWEYLSHTYLEEPSLSNSDKGEDGKGGCRLLCLCLWRAEPHACTPTLSVLLTAVYVTPPWAIFYFARERLFRFFSLPCFVPLSFCLRFPFLSPSELLRISVGAG